MGYLKKIGFTSVNLQILKAFSIFLGGGDSTQNGVGGGDPTQFFFFYICICLYEYNVLYILK